MLAIDMSKFKFQTAYRDKTREGIKNPFKEGNIETILIFKADTSAILGVPCKDKIEPIRCSDAQEVILTIAYYEDFGIECKHIIFLNNGIPYLWDYPQLSEDEALSLIKETQPLIKEETLAGLKLMDTRHIRLKYHYEDHVDGHRTRIFTVPAVDMGLSSPLELSVRVITPLDDNDPKKAKVSYAFIISRDNYGWFETYMTDEEIQVFTNKF